MMIHYVVGFYDKKNDSLYNCVKNHYQQQMKAYIRFDNHYRPFSTKELLRQMLHVIFHSKKRDCLFVFGGEEGIKLWFLSRLLFRPRMVLTHNLIFDPERIRYSKIGRIKKWMYKTAFKSKSFFATLNSSGLIPIYSELFSCEKECFFVVNDSMEITDEMLDLSKKDKIERYVFCGGKAYRDIECFVRVVENLPSVNFIGIFKKDMITKKMYSLKNLKVLHDVDLETFNKYLCEATVCCIPLKSISPCGLLVMQQAALMGVPIVSTETPSMRTVVPNSTCGFLFPQGKDKLMASAIEQILCSESLYKSIGNNAKKNMANYTPDKIALQLIEAIDCVKNGAKHITNIN